MIRKYANFKLILSIFILTGLVSKAESMFLHGYFGVTRAQDLTELELQKNEGITAGEFKQMNVQLLTMLAKNDLEGCQIIVNKLLGKVNSSHFKDNKILSETYYFVGVYYLFVKNYYESIKFLNFSIDLKVLNNEYDEQYAKGLYNLGFAYYGIKDFIKVEEYSLKALETEKKIHGETSSSLIDTYSNLILAYIELQEYDRATYYLNIALSIANNNPDKVSPYMLANLYSNFGVCFNRQSDFSKAKIYFDQSESIHRNSHLNLDDTYINLMNSMAITYGALGFSEKSNEYYERGIALALSNNSSFAFNNINSYAIVLGNMGDREKGEVLLKNAVGRARTKFGSGSHGYYEVLCYYADYLREYKIDINKSVELYKRCMDYLKLNDHDLLLRDPVQLGYSLSLSAAGEPGKALEIIQSLLFSEKKERNDFRSLENPDIDNIKADKRSLTILKTKYRILCGLYDKSSEEKYLEASSNTSELIVALLEKVRINISEEESRLVLGDRYRDSYLNAIRDFHLLYSKTSDKRFLEKAFEYSEKSKIAGLLAATRELKAVQFHIPEEIADSERRLQRDISLINARISDESAKETPDPILINKWKENLLIESGRRDSLVLVFEKQYPDYYAIKYNTQVATLQKIPEIIGKNVNYVNYIVSDSLLYIFVANRKHQQLLALPVDSSFKDNLRQFRGLLSFPSPSGNARIAFEKFVTTGYKLYKMVVEPIRPYLISNKILISPDNILSYIPFETLPTAEVSEEKLLYNRVPYLMNELDISYTYSATFMAESDKRDYSLFNKLIAFAPNYPEPIDIQSVVMNRQAVMNKLQDLPFARQEAEYVSEITGGKLFENNDANESVYKAEAGKYDIIHLAMHTILNDKDPMHSTLIFSKGKDSTDDGYLKTYEIYGIPLKAKMVVLSSCNTGAGILYSGEGILSLARGFMYSGSESVVMSMWEIEDRSGTEIVKLFYDNLKKGFSKSMALRKARLTYLKKSDQLRSHPYFWSALIIYGNNTPLYYSRYLKLAVICLMTAMLLYLTIYFIRRMYS